MQDKQLVEELGMALQKLARKAFPESRAKEFNCILEGRFYQALLYTKVTKALKINTQGQKQWKDRISKFVRADKWIRSLVSPVQ